MVELSINVLSVTVNIEICAKIPKNRKLECLYDFNSKQIYSNGEKNRKEMFWDNMCCKEFEENNGKSDSRSGGLGHVDTT